MTKNQAMRLREHFLLHGFFSFIRFYKDYLQLVALIV